MTQDLSPARSPRSVDRGDRPVPAGVTPSSGGARFAALDGIRGLAVVMVVLGHGFLIWPRSGITQVRFVEGVFLGGSVVVLLVLGGYVITRSLLADTERGGVDPFIFVVRRLVRIWVQLLPYLAVVWLVALLVDSLGGSTQENRIATTVALLTATFNFEAIRNVFGMSWGGSGGLGHLWYLSVLMQAYVVLPLLVLVLRGRRVLILVLSLALVAYSTWFRIDLYHDTSTYSATLHTLARMDGIFLGVAIAAAEPWLRRRPVAGGVTLLVGLVGWAGLVLSSAEVPEPHHLNLWATGVLLAGGACCAGVVMGARGGLTRLLTVRPLVWLGRSSLVVYLWHFSVFWWVGTRLSDEPTWVKVSVSLVSLLVVTVVADRLVERPTRRWLSTHLLPRRSS